MKATTRMLPAVRVGGVLGDEPRFTCTKNGHKGLRARNPSVVDIQPLTNQRPEIMALEEMSHSMPTIENGIGYVPSPAEAVTNGRCQQALPVRLK